MVPFHHEWFSICLRLYHILLLWLYPFLFYHYVEISAIPYTFQTSGACFMLLLSLSWFKIHYWFKIIYIIINYTTIRTILSFVINYTVSLIIINIGTYYMAHIINFLSLGIIPTSLTIEGVVIFIYAVAIPLSGRFTFTCLDILYRLGFPR